MTGHRPLGLVDVFAATIPTLDFVPAVHVNYAETVLRMKGRAPQAQGFSRRIGRLRRVGCGMIARSSLRCGQPRRNQNPGRCAGAPASRVTSLTPSQMP
jgi:hypothetical protein